MPRSNTGAKRVKKPPDSIKQAVEAVTKNGMKIRQAAREFQVPRATLQRHLKNKKENPDTEFECTNNCDIHKVFTGDEEQILCQYLQTACKMHYGLGIKDVTKLAYDLAFKNNKKYPISWDRSGCAGKQWYYDFMRRHPELSLRKPEATSLARATAFNRHTVKTFFDKYTQVLEKYKFPPENVYNLDETGMTTVHRPGKVIATKGSKQVGSITSGERGPTVTLVGCINAIGSAIPPMLIFPRVHFNNNMLNGAPAGATGAANPSGWITGDIFAEFMRHFIKHTKPSKTNPVLLILDNHETHISIQSINLAKENGVVLLTIPPHTSHKLQPLDRGVYGPLKMYYNTACTNWLHCNPGRQITIYEIGALAGIAYPQAFTPLNILSGFKSTGIWPLNSDIFQDDDFMSSAVTDRPNTSLENRNEQTTSSSTPVNEPQASTSGFMSPFVVKPLPQAMPRKMSNRGRKPGRCRILTDTPEKLEIEAQYEKQKKKIPVKRILEESETSDTDLSSEETIKVSDGDFCITKLKGKIDHFYVTKVLNVTDVHYAVRYFAKLPKTNTFVSKDLEMYLISHDDVVAKLPKPMIEGTTGRRQYKFETHLMEKFRVE